MRKNPVRGASSSGGEKIIKQENEVIPDPTFIYRENTVYSNGKQDSQTTTSKSIFDRTINGKTYGVESDISSFKPIKQEPDNGKGGVCICSINARNRQPQLIEKWRNRKVKIKSMNDSD